MAYLNISKMTPLSSYVIWDWNGTLLDDLSAALHASNTMLVRRGLPPLSRERYREIFGFPVRDFYRAAGFVLEREDWDSLAREFHSLFLSDGSLSLFPDAKEILQDFQQRKIGQSLLTVSRQSIVDRQLKAFGITPFFQRVFGVDNLDGVSKRELGAALLASLPVSYSSIVMVGDTLHDAEVASSLGVSCVLIAAGHQSRERLSASGFPVCATLSEFQCYSRLNCNPNGTGM